MSEAWNAVKSGGSEAEVCATMWLMSYSHVSINPPPSMDVLTLRAEIKTWERAFRASNSRDPSVQDIKENPEIGWFYLTSARVKHLAELLYRGQIPSVQKTVQISRSK